MLVRGGVRIKQGMLIRGGVRKKRGMLVRGGVRIQKAPLVPEILHTHSPQSSYNLHTLHTALALCAKKGRQPNIHKNYVLKYCTL